MIFSTEATLSPNPHHEVSPIFLEKYYMRDGHHFLCPEGVKGMMGSNPDRIRVTVTNERPPAPGFKEVNAHDAACWISFGTGAWGEFIRENFGIDEDAFCQAMEESEDENYNVDWEAVAEEFDEIYSGFWILFEDVS